MSEIFHPDDVSILLEDRNGCIKDQPCMHCTTEDIPSNHLPAINKPVISTQQLINTRPPSHPASNTSICNMSKHRVIVARPHLLLSTPQHAPPRSKSWHPKFSKKPSIIRSHFSESQSQTASVNGNASDSDLSVFTNDNDTSSIISDTVSSVLNEDFNQTLTLAFKPPSDDELPDLRFSERENLFASLPAEKSNVQEEEMSENSEATSLADYPSILEQTDLRLMSLPNRIPHHSYTSAHQNLSNPRLSDLSTDRSVDETSDITTLSCSSMSLDQDGLMLSDQVSKNSCSEITLLQREKANSETEIRSLKQSLKLSEADTAILVSAKQQLQLDLHEASENVKALRHKLQKALVSSAQHEKSSIVWKATLEKEREKYGADVKLAKEQIDHIKKKLETVSKDFDETLLEKDEMKLEKKNLKRNLETLESLNKNLQKEVNQVVGQNTKLNSIIEKNNQDHVGNQEYVDIVRSERDEYVKRLHEKDQDILQHQMTARRLEERLSQLNEVNLKVSAEKDDLFKSTQDQTLLISSLKAQLALKFSEKEALDGAISQLHGDLHKVEAGFTKIKQEIALKSGVAEREHSLNDQLKNKVKKLEEEIRQLHLQAKVHTQRIADKNNQIVQLLNQVKASKQETSCDTNEISKLKTNLISMERKWTEVVQKEKLVSSDLKRRSVSLAASEKHCEDLKKTLESQKSKITEYEVEVQKLKDSVQHKNGEMLVMQQKLSGNESKHKTKNKLLVASFEQEKLLLNKTVQDLQLKVDEQQKLLVSHEPVVDKNVPNPQIELVAELQDSRRELSMQVANLHQEKDKLKLELEKQIEVLVDKLNEQHNAHLKQSTEEALKHETLIKNATQLQQQLKDQIKTSESLKYELSQTTDKYVCEKETVDHLENTKKQYEREVSNLKTKHLHLKEELATVKQEMNMNAMKLMEDLQQSSSSQFDKNKLEVKLTSVEEERNKLKEAVEQQQRYIVALQAHYQQWANNAAQQLQESLDSKQHKQEDSATQTDHDEDFVNFKNKRIEEISCSADTETSTQTDHDNELIHVTIPTRKLNETSSQTDHDMDFVHGKNFVSLMETSTQTDHDNESIHVTIPSGKFNETSSQTDHDMDFVHGKNFVSLMETSTQTDHDNELIHVTIPSVKFNETSSQTDHDMEFVYGKNFVSLMETSTQTDHDHELIHVTIPSVKFNEISSQTDHDMEFVYGKNFVHLMETSTQTDHDNELIHVTIPSVKFNETSSQTDHDMEFVHGKNYVNLMETSTQTDHDNELIHVTIPSVKLNETSSQTDHDMEFVHGKNFVNLMETSTQTDHDNELIHVTIPSVKFNETSSQTDHDVEFALDENFVHLMETSTQTDHDNELIHVTIPSVKFNETSSQTDHDMEFVHGKNFVHLMETSTQTDHDNELIHATIPSAKFNEVSSQTDLDMELGFMHAKCWSKSECQNQLVCGTDIPVNLKEISTQTDHNEEIIGPKLYQSYFDYQEPTVRNEAQHVLNVDRFTQTDHDEKPISSSPHKSRQITCSKCHRAVNLDCKQVEHCEEYTHTTSEINVDNDSSYMSHESLDVAATALEHYGTCLQCSECRQILMNASVQTDHDRQPIYDNEQYSGAMQVTDNVFEKQHVMYKGAAKKLFQTQVVSHSYSPTLECDALHSLVVSTECNSTHTDHELEECVAAVSPSNVENISTQTSLMKTQCQSIQTESLEELEKSDVCESSTQTEHSETVVGKSKPHEEQNICVVDDRICSDGLCTKCGKPTSAERSFQTSGSQTEEKHQLSPLPNPQDVARILSSGDAAKLKAYKNTVNLLKRKLQTAQDKISAQEADIETLKREVIALSNLLQSKEEIEVSGKLVEKAFEGGRLEEELSRWKGVAESREFENSTLKAEVEKLTQSFKYEAEKQRRKSIGEKMLQEKKIKEANGRVVALVEANEKLRKSVEKLQVKMTTCSSQLECAQRDKLRYQNRARKLQANLRSLSWLSTSGSEGTEKENPPIKSSDENYQMKRDSMETSSTVKDIDNLLSTLRSEIISLENQLNDHNEVVNRSKATWKELRRPLLSENRNVESAIADTAIKDDLGEIV